MRPDSSTSSADVLDVLFVPKIMPFESTPISRTAAAPTISPMRPPSQKLPFEEDFLLLLFPEFWMPSAAAPTMAPTIAPAPAAEAEFSEDALDEADAEAFDEDAELVLDEAAFPEDVPEAEVLDAAFLRSSSAFFAADSFAFFAFSRSSFCCLVFSFSTVFAEALIFKSDMRFHSFQFVNGIIP